MDPTCLPDDWPDDPGVVDALMCSATDILRAASAYTVGLCRRTVRPCAPQATDVCDGPCGCDRVCQMYIGQRHVHAVEAVWVDGEQLPDDLYRLYDGNRLVFAPDACPPRCQRLDLPVTHLGTWGITYLEGYPPDALASRAATAIAVDLLRSCADRCRSDMRGVTATVVDGESRTYGEATDVWQGLAEVTDWLDVVNPYRARRPALYIDPDHMPPPTERTC